MFLTWTTIHYPIKVVSILGIWTINWLIPPKEMELMVRYRLKREVYDYLCIRFFPKDNLVLPHYILGAWWLHLLDGLGHYVIYLVEIAYILIMTNNVMTLGYSYAKRRLKNPPNIFYQILHISRLIAWIPSILPGLLRYEGWTDPYCVPDSPRRPLELPTKKYRPFLIPLLGTRSGTWDALTPSIPTPSSTYSTNP